jgi:predicted TIM-barrel fold metal-dependent hydrolase
MCIQIFNDAMLEIQKESGNRIYPMAVLPWWDVGASVKEVQRVKEMGMHGIVTTSDPHTLGLPHLGQESWNPVWEVCEDLEMPVNFHIGGSSVGIQTYTAATWPGAGPETAMSLGSAAIYGDNQRVIGNLIFWGVPERFPRIKIVSVESGVGWLPFYLQALDHQAVETSPNETSFFTLKPSEYFRRNFHCSFWFETEMLKPALDYIGTDNVMFETDYPHPTCIYPDPRSTLKKAVADLSDETVRKLTQDNASRLYRIPV